MSQVPFLQTLLNPTLNAPQDIPHVALDISVVKSQNTQTQMLQVLLSDLITRKLLSMTLTVNLNHQFQPWAVEIHDVFVYGPLP